MLIIMPRDCLPLPLSTPDSVAFMLRPRSKNQSDTPLRSRPGFTQGQAMGAKRSPAAAASGRPHREAKHEGSPVGADRDGQPEHGGDDLLRHLRTRGQAGRHTHMHTVHGGSAPPLHQLTTMETTQLGGCVHTVLAGDGSLWWPARSSRARGPGVRLSARKGSSPARPRCRCRPTPT